MNYLKILTAFIALAFMFASCDNGKGDEQISPDVVDNPASAEGKEKNEKQPMIEFEKKMHNFEKVIEGEKVQYSFKFTNTGKGDLVITSVNADCGCTVAKFPEKPVKPGESKYIDVRFDSRGRLGFNHKRVTVMSNATPNKVILDIKAKVYRPEQITN